MKKIKKKGIYKSKVEICNLLMKKLVPLKGDASIRKFYRKKNNHNTSIIVFAKKEKFKNLLVYDAINKVLNKNKILAPKLYKEN